MLVMGTKIRRIFHLVLRGLTFKPLINPYNKLNHLDFMKTDSMKTQQKSSPHMDLMKKLSDTGGSLKRGLSMRLKSKLTRQDTRAKEDAAETDARKRLSISTDTYGDLEGAARPERHQSLFVDGQTSRVLGLLKNPLVGKLASASSSKRRMMLPRLRMSSLDTERLPDCLVEQEDDRVRLLSRSVQARAKLWRLNAIQLPSVDVEEQVENEGLAATGTTKEFPSLCF